MGAGMDKLAELRRRMAIFLAGLLWLHVPVVAVLAWSLGSDGALAGIGLVVAVAAVATLCVAAARNAAFTRAVLAGGYMLTVSTVVALYRDNPWQVDWHMYYFAALAIIGGFCCWRTVLVATGFVALHHLGLSVVLPMLVFPEAALDLGRVILHAVILVLEAAVLLWLAQRLVAALIASETAVAKARAAEAETARLAAEREADSHAMQDLRRREMLALAADFERSIGRTVEVLNAAATDSQSSAGIFGRAAAASHARAEDAAQAADRVSGGVQSVATAAEELTSSIAEIARQLSQATGLTADASTRARSAAATVDSLTRSAARIEDVVQLIQAVASQTNLLALNATIEAARAGEAGRGFAVVAAEVKGLAGQTAQATEDIAQRIAEIQQATREAVESIGAIGGAVSSIDAATSTIAAAVEEQDAATREISSTAQSVAGDVAQVAGSLQQVRATTAETGDNAARSAGLAQRLAEEVGRLQSGVRSFLDTLRAA